MADQALITLITIDVPMQISGKFRGKINMLLESSDNFVKAQAL
ncbi:hypothetical protein ACFLWS_05230 [Chloroflexota bacterium]